MKKILLIILIFLTGCSSSTLTCSKVNYSTIYGKETITETYNFKNDKFLHYTNNKIIYFDNDMIKYIENLFEYYNEYLIVVNENIKGSSTNINKTSNSIITNIDININSSDDSLEKININKSMSLNYLKKDLIEKGYSCEIEN